MFLEKTWQQDKHYILYDAAIRLGIIIIAALIKLLLILSSEDKSYPSFFTQIPHFTEWCTLLPFSFILIFEFISLKRKKESMSIDEAYMACDLTSSCLFPAIILQLYYIIIYFALRPIVMAHFNGFKISGHLLRAGLGNGIWLRNYSWMKRYQNSLPRPLFVGLSVVIFGVILYEAYENFWTTVYFHTVLEVLTGFILATLNYYLPPLQILMRKIRRKPEKEDESYIEMSDI